MNSCIGSGSFCCPLVYTVGPFWHFVGGMARSVFTEIIWRQSHTIPLPTVACLSLYYIFTQMVREERTKWEWEKLVDMEQSDSSGVGMLNLS